MSTVLIISIALLLTALVGTIVLWIRSGEALVGLCGALFAVIAIHQGVALWNQWGTPLALDTWTLAGFAGVAAGAISIAAVISLRRTLEERDGIETLHWDSMEAVRMLNELASNDEVGLEEKISKLLEIGVSRFGLEVGIVSRVRNDRYEIVAIHAPEEFPVTPGASFSVGDTICQKTLSSKRPVATENLSESTWGKGLTPTTLGFDVYLGAPIRVSGSVYGTLNFARFKPREDRFSATDKDLVALMAQFLGAEIEKATKTKARKTASVARHAPKPSLLKADRTIHANRILQHIEGELRTLAGESVELELKLGSELGPAIAPRVPIDAIVRTLVVNARNAMPEGGKIVIETANLELASDKPGVMPAVAPARYVTLKVSDSGSAPDAEQLAQLYQSASQDAEQASDAADRLSLSAIYRILQASGGDLSVDVEPERGSTFTLYLPRANTPERAPRKSPHLFATPSAPL